MAAPKSDQKFDVRVVEHLLRRGELSVDDYQKWLDSLPDEADEGEQTDTRFTTPYADRLVTDPADA